MKKRMKTKILAVFLVFSLLLPVVPVSSINAVEAQRMPTSNEFAQNEPEIATGTDGATESESTAIVDKLTQGTQILKHIDETVFASQNHIARLEEEETLSSYVFLNSDGTKTVYYMDKEVKYQDSQGNIVEKDISLSNVANGYTTASNDVDLLLPNNPSNGIDFSYNGYDISIVPEGGELRKPVQSNGTSVIYPDYFGSGMSLMYTPSLDGLKEDIVLSRYTGVTSFAFRLYTDGLHLYQENGRCYLAQSETAEMRIDMGDVVSFDARGRFSVGTMTVETLSEGQDYRLILTVDEAFLTAESTTYPVSIDPTLTISDSTHGAGAIEDITLYSGRPNANCDWSYLHCGYYDSTYQVGRTLFRLTGLLSSSLYQALPVGAITSAEFHIKEATGTAALPVGIYANTGSTTWTETGATWNNAGYVVGTQYATASPGINEATTYDITNLVKAWKNNLESAQAGFILKSSNETTLDKAFYSSETTTSSRRPYVVMTYQDTGTGGGVSFAEATTLYFGGSVSIGVTIPNEKRYIKFTPLYTGFYTFQSSNSTGDPKVWLYNSSQAELAVDDDSGENQDYNFALTYHLIKDVIYYIAAGHYGSSTGSYTLTVSTKPSAAALVTYDAMTAMEHAVDINTSYAVQCYRAVVPHEGIFTFQSIQEVGNAKVWIYKSDLSLLSYDDDGGGSGKFQVEAYFAENDPYYIVVGHNGGATGSYNFRAFAAITIPSSNNFAHLQNDSTGMFLDIHGTVEQNLAHQDGLHDGARQRWLIQRQSNEYYTIRSEYGNMYYLGISSTGVGSNNVVLLSSVTDYSLWKIYGTSNGELFIEPKLAPGKTIYVPNSNAGTELQLCWMSDAVDDRNKWKIGVEWNVGLEGQKKEDWCWLAATRMVAKRYGLTDSEPEQEDTVDQAVFVEENPGTYEDAKRALNYYSSGCTTENPHDFVTHEAEILSEDVLRRYLDDGHVIYISRGKYNDDSKRVGHASVIVGYTCTNSYEALTYQYIIYDPWPENPPAPWPENPIQTEGQRLVRSYQWIRYGSGIADEFSGDLSWDGFIAKRTTYIEETVFT